MYASCATLSASSAVNPITGITDCCARAASGQAAAPPKTPKNSRRCVLAALALDEEF